MISAALDKQLIVTLKNQVGALAEVTSIISSHGINMVAICAYAIDDKGSIMFVSSDSAKAKKILRDKQYNVREETVVLVTLDNKPGALQVISDKISKYGIDISLLYGSVDQESAVSRLVIISEDNKSLLMAINMGLN